MKHVSYTILMRSEKNVKHKNGICGGTSRIYWQNAQFQGAQIDIDKKVTGGYIFLKAMKHESVFAFELRL